MTRHLAGNERRHATRLHGAEAHGITTVRIRPGHRGIVIDVSVLGALLETNHQLMPGTVVQVHMEREAHRATIRARVLRCLVSSIRASCVKYRGAVVFDRHLQWFETAATLPRGEAATRTPADAGEGRH